jgi:hypothetical protein
MHFSYTTNLVRKTTAIFQNPLCFALYKEGLIIAEDFSISK